MQIVAAVTFALTGCGSSSPEEPATGAEGSVAGVTDPTTAASDSMTADTESPAARDTSAETVDTAASGTDAATSTAGRDQAPPDALADGPVTYVALGDSLTFGEGDEEGLGYVGRLAAEIAAAPGRAESSVVNLGQSGWDSTQMVGQEGSPGQLDAALAEVNAAVAAGRAALATVLIGSNDLWYLYEYPTEGTTAADEDAAAETYRDNLDRTVRELSAAGAVVILGLPDDQSVRPGVVEIALLHNYLPNITVEEVQKMSAVAERLGTITEEVAAEHGVRTVDTNAPFWADTAKMSSDGIHPAAAGYADLAELWLPVIQDVL